MIQLYTGVPGSGKSYKMVHDLAAFLEREPNITVVSNIRNLKLSHIDLDEMLDEAAPGKKRSEKVETFFRYENQQKLNEDFDGPILYVIDECQLLFPRRTQLPHTEEYFQRHRHLGHYVFLATQAAKMNNTNLIPLIEIEYHAARRTISFFGEIHYKEKSPQSKDIIRKFSIRPKKAIFDLYQSFETAEIKKPKPALFKLLFLPLLLSPVFYLFYDKYLNVPVKAEAKASSKGPSSEELNKYKRELSRLRSENAKLKNRVTRISEENVSLKQAQEETERVFLPVVQHGGKMLSVDPDTQAVADIKHFGRKVSCVNGGLTCFYDRPLNSGIKRADTYSQMPLSAGLGSAPMDQSALLNSLHSIALPSSLKQSPGSFVDASLVPSPETPGR